MEIQTLESNTLVILKAGDLREFAEKLATRQPAPAPTPNNDEPISQPEAVKMWRTTRQRLANLRRQGKIEAMELNGRIYYKRSAFAEAMQSLNRYKKPLV